MENMLLAIGISMMEANVRLNWWRSSRAKSYQSNPSSKLASTQSFIMLPFHRG
jgi:hypothetical protein